MIDLRSPSLAVGMQWLYQNLLLRDVGHTPSATPFLRHDLRREFAAVLYVPISSPILTGP